MDAKVIDWQSQAWDEIVPRLLLFASTRLLRMTWRGVHRGSPPGAAEAADFVNDAISKTISGARVWNSEACSLYQHLAGVIVSDISHAAISMENRTTQRDAVSSETDLSPVIQIGTKARDQETEVLWLSEQRKLFEYLDRIDQALRQMAELMLLRDMTETDELSRTLNISPAEVANRRKRLKRTVRAYLTGGRS